jgi:hypothetical protein
MIKSYVALYHGKNLLLSHDEKWFERASKVRIFCGVFHANEASCSTFRKKINGDHHDRALVLHTHKVGTSPRICKCSKVLGALLLCFPIMKMDGVSHRLWLASNTNIDSGCQSASQRSALKVASLAAIFLSFCLRQVSCDGRWMHHHRHLLVVWGKNGNLRHFFAKLLWLRDLLTCT